MGRVVALLVLGSSWCACTNDFGGFSFRQDEDTPAPGQDASQSAPIGEDGGPLGVGPSGDAALDGAVVPPIDGPDGAANDGGSPTTDAGDGATADVDAGQEPVPPETMMCRSDLMATAASETCASCGCEQCAGEVTTCLDDTDPLCSAVVQCALQNDCMFWGCYCRTPQCARTSPGGDGPCAAAIEAAAGGAKAVVMAKWESNDLSEPLVRARNLIVCTLGLDAQHPLGPVTGRCAEQCP